MLQRVLLHLSLAFLFAFTQMGVATHAVSHLTDSHEQRHQDQNSNEHQCGQCISLSHIADANLTHTFNFTVTPAEQAFVTGSLKNVTTSGSFSYSVRAPPHHSQT